MVSVDIVAPNLVDQVWPQIADGMAKSCRKTGNDLAPGYLWQECRSGHAFLVLAHDEGKAVGAVIVRFEYGTKSVLRGLGMCGQDFKGWLAPMREKLTEMAKQGGASVFVDEGRPGLVKLIDGAKTTRVTYEVEVK